MFNPQACYKWHSKTAIWCFPKSCSDVAECVCVGYLKCLLGSHAIQWHIAKPKYIDTPKNLAHGNNIKRGYYLKNLSFDKMHRNKYMLEISKQFLWIGYFSSVHLDFSVMDLTNLTIKWVIIKGDFKYVI